MSKTRLYHVRAIIGASEKEYLIDAGNVNAAKLHVSRKHIEADTASGKDVARLMGKGVVPESAIKDDRQADIAFGSMVRS